MSFEDRPRYTSQVADLNAYGRELNSCESVAEVVSLSIEAVSLLFEFQYATFVEVHGDDDLRVAHSTYPTMSAGDAPSDIVQEALTEQETVHREGDATGAADESVAATVAVPATIVDEVVAVIVAGTVHDDGFGDDVVRAIEILAAHTATAIGNIRSREQLERAKHDLRKRTEMVEMYDRLIRHDVGNDLQVVAGFAERIADEVDGRPREYAERIEQTARSGVDLLDRVGTLVTTLEKQAAPEPQSLQPVLETAVEQAVTQYESLAVDFDPDAASYRVYGGDLLDSLFENLLTNAAVHNEGAVHVTLDVAVTREEVTVTVADDGSGIPDAVGDSLFEMGVSGPDSDGTGFGLGFVQAMAESYGGEVTASDAPTGGAQFAVTLDRA